MSYSVSEKGKLPACVLDAGFMRRLWDELHKDGDFLWHAKVGTGGDYLGKADKRPEHEVSSWEELVSLLESLPRIDSVTLTFEIEGKGTVAIAYKNYLPITGTLVVSGDNEAWVKDKFNDIMDLFDCHKDSKNTFIHSKVFYAVLHTVIPLAVAFVVVIGVAGILLRFLPPDWSRAYIGWMVAATLIANLKLASVISDKLLTTVIKKYPYIQWLS